MTQRPRVYIDLRKKNHPFFLPSCKCRNSDSPGTKLRSILYLPLLLFPIRSVSYAFAGHLHILFTTTRLLVQDVVDWPHLPVSCAWQERSHSIMFKAEPIPKFSLSLHIAEASTVSSHWLWHVCLLGHHPGHHGLRHQDRGNFSIE